MIFRDQMEDQPDSCGQLAAVDGIPMFIVTCLARSFGEAARARTPTELDFRQGIDVGQANAETGFFIFEPPDFFHPIYTSDIDEGTTLFLKMFLEAGKQWFLALQYIDAEGRPRTRVFGIEDHTVVHSEEADHWIEPPPDVTVPNPGDPT